MRVGIVLGVLDSRAAFPPHFLFGAAASLRLYHMYFVLCIICHLIIFFPVHLILFHFVYICFKSKSLRLTCNCKFSGIVFNPGNVYNSSACFGKYFYSLLNGPFFWNDHATCVDS